jgi:nickel superoxide dismutase
MIGQLVDKLNQRYSFSFDVVDAHCDIPCKIYDPSTAQIAALTVIRMLDLMADLEANTQTHDVAYLNTMMRYIAQKEEHGLRCKEEIRVIWGDYFKQPQLEQFPEIHQLTHGIMMQASKCKQQADRAHGLELLDKVNRFAEIFWMTKNVKVKRAICPYPPELEGVYPDL